MTMDYASNFHISDNEDLAVMLLTAGCDIALMDVQKTSLPFFEAVLRNQVKVMTSLNDNFYQTQKALIYSVCLYRLLRQWLVKV